MYDVPDITEVCISVVGDVDGVNQGTAHHAKKFTGQHLHRVLENTGHNMPQENPEVWVQAILDAREMSK